MHRLNKVDELMTMVEDEFVNLPDPEISRDVTGYSRDDFASHHSPSQTGQPPYSGSY
jgi:hypothetical protein